MEEILAELEIFAELEAGVIKRTGKFHRDSTGERQPVDIAGDLDHIGEPVDFLRYIREWMYPH